MSEYLQQFKLIPITASKKLPKIQPKQECPGFRCDSGMTKCIPKNRMCDKIIDCLDGEDEYNCDVIQSSETNTLSVQLTNKVNMSQSYNEISANTNILNDSYNISTAKSDIKYDSNNSNDFIIVVTKPTTSNSEEKETISRLTTEISRTYIDYTTTLSPEVQTAELNTKSDELEEDLKCTSTEKVSNVNYTQENENDVRVDDNHIVDPSNVTKLSNEELGQKLITLNHSKYPIDSISFILESSTMQNNDVLNQENNDLTTTELNLDNFLQTSTHDNTNDHFDSDIGQSSNKLIIESLSNSDLVLENFNDGTNTNSNIIEIIDQVSSDSTSVEDSHNIRQLDTRSEIINDVDKIMFSEFQPAKKRKKNLASKEFNCSR